jgi:hypothetical protein
MHRFMAADNKDSFKEWCTSQQVIQTNQARIPDHAWLCTRTHMALLNVFRLSESSHPGAQAACGHPKTAHDVGPHSLDQLWGRAQRSGGCVDARTARSPNHLESGMGNLACARLNMAMRQSHADARILVHRKADLHNIINVPHWTHSRDGGERTSPL